MSEYQYYEFAAVDQPLTAKQQAELNPTLLWRHSPALPDEGEPGFSWCTDCLQILMIAIIIINHVVYMVLSPYPGAASWQKSVCSSAVPVAKHAKSPK
jgi:hypothetical protein